MIVGGSMDSGVRIRRETASDSSSKKREVARQLAAEEAIRKEKERIRKKNRGGRG